MLQPLLDKLLFLGSDFERAFDTFEILYGFEYAHLAGRNWGPIGRFGWRDILSDSSPLMNLIKEAENAGDNWPPVAAGLCGGSIEKLKSIAGVFSPERGEQRHVVVPPSTKTRMERRS